MVGATSCTNSTPLTHTRPRRYTQPGGARGQIVTCQILTCFDQRGKPTRMKAPKPCAELTCYKCRNKLKATGYINQRSSASKPSTNHCRSGNEAQRGGRPPTSQPSRPHLLSPASQAAGPVNQQVVTVAAQNLPASKPSVRNCLPEKESHQCRLDSFSGGMSRHGEQINYIVPAYWNEGIGGENDHGQHDTRFRVHASSQLFSDIRALLERSVNLTRYYIVGFYLIRDESKFLRYSTHKMSLNPIDNVNERWGWHGTAAENINSVLTNGFLRDYNNVSRFGKGTYFAKDAAYALQRKYAKPDANGVQHMLLARVLLGSPCIGREGMARPSRKANETVLQDSMVDNVTNPSIYVTYSDAQAYPEFMVSCKLIC